MRSTKCSAERAEAITQRIAEMVARDLRSISVVEGVGFTNLMSYLEPCFFFFFFFFLIHTESYSEVIPIARANIKGHLKEKKNKEKTKQKNNNNNNSDKTKKQIIVFPRIHT